MNCFSRKFSLQDDPFDITVDEIVKKLLTYLRKLPDLKKLNLNVTLMKRNIFGQMMISNELGNKQNKRVDEKKTELTGFM